MINRIQAIQSKLQRGEALLITGSANRFYFTGFRSSAGLLMIAPQKAEFFIDFRYYEKASKTIHHCDVALSGKLGEQLAAFTAKHEIQTIYTENSYITLAERSRFQKMLPGIRFSEEEQLDAAILQLRSIKTPEEIRRIKQSQKITDETFSYILERIRAGRTEREIMLDMEFFLRRQGSEGVAFDFIVVSGKNSSMPHGVPTDKPIEHGDFITMDFGAVYEGYCSDMTRTVAVGEVDDLQKTVYATVLTAQKKAMERIAPGAICKEVDVAARNYICNSGFDGCFGHGLGHSLGIEVHEAPCFNTTDQSRLEPGMVLSVEPGIYLPDRFGVRIEDLVIITESGFEDITASPKELIIL